MAKRKSPKEMLEKVLNPDSLVKVMEAYAEQEALGFYFYLNKQRKENKLGNRGLMKLWWDYRTGK